MKKFFSFFSVLAMAIAAVSFTSCEKDDDPTNDIDVPQAKTYAKYVARVSDDFLKYGDVTVTFVANNETKTYKMSETASTVLDLHTLVDDVTGKLSVHELVIPVFEVKSKPVKATVKFELSEAGKKACEAAADDLDMVFLWTHGLGECNEDGAFKAGEKHVSTTKCTEISVKNLPALLGISHYTEGSLVSKEL